MAAIVSVIHQIKIKEKGKHSNCFTTWYLDLIALDDGQFSVRLYSLSKSKKSYGCAYGKTTTHQHKLNADGERMVLAQSYNFSSQDEAEIRWDSLLSDYSEKSRIRENSCVIVNVRKYKIWEEPK